MSRLLPIPLVIATVMTSLARPADARRTQGRTGSVALVPVTGDHHAIVAELNRLLEQAAREAGLTVVAGAALRRRLQSDPGRSLRRCSANPRCIGRLARKARTELVAVGACSSVDDGTLATIQVIDSRGRVEREATFRVDHARDVRQALAGAFETLFLVPPPATLTGPTDDVLAAMGDLALAPVEHELGEPLHDPLDEPLKDPLEDEPMDEADPAELRDPLEDDPLIEPTPDPLQFAGTEARVSPVVPVPSPAVGPAEPSEWLFYASIAVAGAGAATAATGSYFGLQAMLSVNDANDDRTISQARAADIQQEADDYAETANLLFVIGGSVVAAGAILFSLDLLMNDSVEPSVTASPTGASASVRFSF